MNGISVIQKTYVCTYVDFGIFRILYVRTYIRMYVCILSNREFPDNPETLRSIGRVVP